MKLRSLCEHIIIIIIVVCLSKLANIIYFVFLDVTSTCDFGLQSHSILLLTESNCRTWLNTKNRAILETVRLISFLQYIIGLLYTVH